jgi:hypothetical protein
MAPEMDFWEVSLAASWLRQLSQASIHKMSSPQGGGEVWSIGEMLTPRGEFCSLGGTLPHPCIVLFRMTAGKTDNIHP